MIQIKNARTAKLADDLIGAAQALEREARRLKDKANMIRQYGLTKWSDTDDVVQHMALHAAADIKNGTVQALREVGVVIDGLQEVAWEKTT